MANLRDLSSPSICHRDLMLATPGKLFSAAGWFYELKYDGFRSLASKRGDVVRLESRNGKDLGCCFPEVLEELRAIEADFAIDGELVIVDGLGRPDWRRLHRRHVIRRADRVRLAAAQDPAAIFAFDLLELRGTDCRPYPLRLRKAMLADLLKRSPRVKYAQHWEGSSTELWALAVQLELEGIVAKDAESVYSPGRTTRWLKIKTDVGAERERARRPR